MKRFCLSITLALVAIFSILAFGPFNLNAFAAENEKPKLLTSEQIKEMNIVLEELRIQVNEKLDKGETNVTAYGDLSFQTEPIGLSFQVQDQDSPFSLFATEQSKYFYAEVFNTKGFNFSHVLSGTFLWGAGKVGNYSYTATLTGGFYGKTHSTKDFRLDPSVVEISSAGKFKALKYAPVEYTTHIRVELYGSGTYRLTRAQIGL